jgi:uncharacterized membrane protein
MAMALLALLVGLTSLRFVAAPFGVWPALDEAIQQAILPIPFAAMTHMVIAPIALLLGPVQLHPGFRARHPRVHRIMGRIYVASCVAAGIAAVVMAFHASGGPVAGLGFGLLGVCWIAATVGAWQAAVRRRFALHRQLMLLSYAATFGAVTLRLQLALGFALGFSSYAAMSVWLAWTSWLPNVLVVVLWSMATRTHVRGLASQA